MSATTMVPMWPTYGTAWLWRTQINPAAVYDGDTLRVTIDRGFGDRTVSKPVRLLGIDTPELRGDERPLGLDARDWVREWVLNGNLTAMAAGLEWPFVLETRRGRAATGKYGRLLGVIWRHNSDGRIQAPPLNLALVLEGKANPYQ